ncbi:hypothetical protein [Helicobacter didelphidarum]|nr:hypothetical protein [Helicobacter didelphidarum]
MINDTKEILEITNAIVFLESKVKENEKEFKEYKRFSKEKGKI